MGKMAIETLNKLTLVIEKYRRMPDTTFLVYEAYIEDENGEICYCFEVRDYDKEEAEKDIVDESIKGKNDEAAGEKRFTSFSSARRPGKKYCVLTGEEIVDRAIRLKSFLECNYIQPPGSLKDGNKHFGFDIKGYSSPNESQDYENLIKCKNLDTCVFKSGCPKHKDNNIIGLRHGGNVVNHTKTLQTVLFKFGYGDEMRFEKYKTDGIYGKRTRLAVSSFIREVNFLEKKVLKPVKGNFISKTLAEEIELKCEQGWERERYYLFDDDKWDLRPGVQKDELSWLKWRHHVRQLQYDLKYLTITAMDYLPYSNMENPIDVNIDEYWEEGMFDEWTEKAVRQFQDAALSGARFDPVNRELIWAIPEATYNGRINGIVDIETKNEIRRWFEFIENVVDVKDLTIKDYTSPAVDLSKMQIISPMLACAALTKEDGRIDVLMAVPDEIEGLKIDAEKIKKNLPYFLFLHKPVYEDKPFVYDNCVPSYNFETKYVVADLEKITDLGKWQFYKGTKSVPKEEKYTAECIASSDESKLKNNLSGQPIEMYSEKVKEKIYNIYERQYPGFAEVLAQQGTSLWKITLELKETVKRGIYLLKVGNSNDLKPHPVRVFGKDKSSYNIVHLTDLHIATTYDNLLSYIGYDKVSYNNPNDRLRELIQKIKSQEIPADIVIITGDAVDNSNNYRPYEAQNGAYMFQPIYDKDANWRLLHYMITTDPGIKVPVYITLGNHDFKPNPTSVQNLIHDLNLGEDDAELFPFNTRDAGSGEWVSTWWRSKCYGDYLYADENAVQYYFDNFCPFTDFNITIDSINIILMSSGHDEKIFAAHYGPIEGLWSAIQARIFQHNPSPRSVGFNSEQLGWLDGTIKTHEGKANILCMHSTLIVPPPSRMIAQDINYPSVVVSDITDVLREHDESSIVKGREKLIHYIEEGKIQMVLTGHAHVNVEVCCDNTDTPAKWFVGNFSKYRKNLDLINSNLRLILSTISTGMVGCTFNLKRIEMGERRYDSTERQFTHTGYRKISVTHDGVLLDFKDNTEWRKNGNTE
jgi:3',5'-cyclic AMP phosphodiesterase CpdA